MGLTSIWPSERRWVEHRLRELRPGVDEARAAVRYAALGLLAASLGLVAGVVLGASRSFLLAFLLTECVFLGLLWLRQVRKARLDREFGDLAQRWYTIKQAEDIAAAERGFLARRNVTHDRS